MHGIHHINCGTLFVPGYPTAVCHCLLLEGSNGLTLVDTRIGLLVVRNPVQRLGQQRIEMAGFQFKECDTAVRRIENLGYSISDVRHIVLTHGDPDHVGGLADFPLAEVHLSVEELSHIQSGHWRYVSRQFDHQPRWRTYSAATRNWFGLDARLVALDADMEVLLVPLFGHTLGHCGVAVKRGDRWLLHAGDAHYLRAELVDGHHPVSALSAARADNDGWRIASLNHLRRLYNDHSAKIDLFGYHDIVEFL